MENTTASKQPLQALLSDYRLSSSAKILWLKIATFDELLKGYDQARKTYYVRTKSLARAVDATPGTTLRWLKELQAAGYADYGYAVNGSLWIRLKGGAK